MMDVRTPENAFKDKYRIATGIVLVMMVGVLIRLFQLQVLSGNYYRFFSTQNSIKEDIYRAPRGKIVDRRGNILVGNRPAFDIVVVPQYVVDPKKVFATISQITGMTIDELDQKWAKRFSQPLYQPLLIKSDVSWDEMSAIRTKKTIWYDESLPWDLRGVDVIVRFARYYPEGDIASHLLGYVREIDTGKLEQYKKKYPGRYQIGDTIGVSGIEEKWDLYLRGEDGFKEKVVDALGREVYYAAISDDLETRNPVPGAELQVTVDAELQKLAKELFGTQNGAAVGIDIETGAVILMYSAPSFDLNELAGYDGGQFWGKLATDPEKPLINRAIAGAYPPGSTYKIITGIAALSEGEITPESKLSCAGSLSYGGRPYRCWRAGGHGAIQYHNALVQSCDVFFYRLGLKLGVDKLAKYANLFGLGHATQVGLEGERSGLIPTSKWKEKRFGVPWQMGENLSISVGQGYDLVTPIQNALMVAQVVNGGYRIKPFLARVMYDADGKKVYQEEGGKREKLYVSDDILKQATAALVGVVAEPGGTGHAQSVLPITMGGKTGTAQVVSLERECFSEKCRDHAWFVGFAPADKPKVAFAVLVEHGGFGASAAAPIVGKLAERYAIIEGWIKNEPAENK